jgi:6-phosphogluconolactonase (cycloisomerase 2 family)
MKRFISLAVALSGLVLVTAQTAAPKNPHHGGRHGGQSRVVFVQTNELNGNRIVVFDRDRDGTLTQAGSYATGGDGGIAAPGNESDRLASQGSLSYDGRHSLLIAVNAGSDTVSTFKVRGDRLRLTGVVPSGGGFPASIAVSGRLVYVLNSGGTGIVQGFVIRGHRLHALPGSARSLGLANTDPPNFLMSPGQVGFTPDGTRLIVTTKASGSNIVVYRVRPNGYLSMNPAVNTSATPVPFAFTFDPFDRLVSGEAGQSFVTTYRIAPGGTLSNPQSLSDNQMALCWIVRARGFYYVANTASNTLSGYRISSSGQPSLIGATGIVATTEAGPIDLVASGRFLYGQTGSAGTLDEYRVNADGTLTKLGVITGLPVGQEGIAAN